MLKVIFWENTQNSRIFRKVIKVILPSARSKGSLKDSKAFNTVKAFHNASIPTSTCSARFSPLARQLADKN